MNSNLQNGYEWFQNITDCYDCLVDELSKKLFWARVNYDISGSFKGLIDMLEYASITEDQKKQTLNFYNKFYEISKKQTPIYLYGAAKEGLKNYRCLKDIGANIVAFIDRKYEKLRTYCGIPIIAPPQCKEDIEENSLIFISSIAYKDDILEYLYNIGINKDQILKLDYKNINEKDQYFDFPQKYKKGVFVDAGCLNLETSIRFANWCNGDYKKIIAFEPDKKNYENCLTIANEKKLSNIEIVKAGLGKEKGIAFFDATNNGHSRITVTGTEKIDIVTLDDIVKEEKVSFIKMDIEGAELDALQGGKQTIQRDKPLCAISIYHKPGDIIVIMQYLKELVPEYQFAVRHYTAYSHETVLYAFI